MADEELELRKLDAVVGDIKAELERASPSRKQRIYEAIALAALSAIPWVGGVFAAGLAIKIREGDVARDSLVEEWLREHQQKLEILSKYLRAYRLIFDKNPKAKFFETSYVDAFAGTGEIPRPTLQGFFKDDPDLLKAEEEFRKGSVKRALEVDPPFHHYIFIEKDSEKCEELEALAEEFSKRDIKIICEDANTALLNWCKQLDTKRARAVVFLDPFGASVEWKVIEAIADTKAVDLWILFPYGAINRMLVSDALPPKAWADRLTRIFGTDEWKKDFYSTSSWQSLIDPEKRVERTYKTADQERITEFFMKRLKGKFAAVAKPGFLYNSKGLLFVLMFAAGNEKGANAGVKIANDLMKGLSQ